uniref:Uncharacterized protein n=1 Tax=Biomphalaria glabrata TaxID=6526 RepID=A0A2C9M2D8_BIOGL
MSSKVLFLALALYATLMVLGVKCEEEEVTTPASESIEDTEDDADFEAFSEYINSAVKTLSQSTGTGPSGRRDLAKRGWLKKVWQAAKPLIITAAVNAVGKRSAEDEMNFKNLALRVPQKRGWLKDIWDKVKPYFFKSAAEILEDAIKYKRAPGEKKNLVCTEEEKQKYLEIKNAADDLCALADITNVYKCQ